MLGCRVLALLALGVLAAPLPARAAFHFTVISELLTSYGGSADVQAVEIELLSSGQTLTENSVLAVFDATGAYVADALIVPADIATGGAGRHWLMGTTAFETTSGLQVDFEFAPALPVAGGMVCWGAPGIVPPSDPGSWDHAVPANYVDCVAYGTYTGPTNGFIGTPTPLTAEGHSLQRISETHDNATDFACGDPMDPENNADATTDLVATTACPAPPTPQTRAQQGCINALNKAGAGALKARSALARSCVGAFQKGQETSGADCVAADAKGKVGKADGKTLAAEAKSCEAGELPDFAYAGGGAVNDATELQFGALLTAIFGADLDAALVPVATNADAARCQSQGVAGATKLADAYMKAALKAKKSVLKAGAADADAFLTAFAGALDQGKLATQGGKLNGQIAARCAGADVPVLFPGNCANSATVEALASCLTSNGQIQACAAFFEMDALPNASCN